ncbi:MAG: TonB-dependent receptor [Pseudomonadota bacterium]
MNYNTTQRGCNRSRSQRALFSASLLSVSGLALMATPALAQDAAEDEEDKVIVVTGSRIAIESPIEAPSPITVLDQETIQTNGEADLATLLRDIPALQGTLPGIDSVNQAAAGDSSDLGLSLLNLRQLGTVRTLTLVDGRRHVPGTGGSAAVDINHIPSNRIKTVEVLTGGASSVYGADAVTGVVNFQLRTGRDFDGLEYNIQGGISDEGDAESYSASVALGGEFADGRGSAVFSAEYRKTTSLRAQDRDFAGIGFSSLSAASQETLDLLGISNDELGLPDGELPANAFVINNTLPITSGFGLISLQGSGFVAGLDAAAAAGGPPPTIAGTDIPVAQVFADGVLRPFDPGVAVGGFDSSGGDGIGQNPLGFILPDLDQVVVSAAADYEITPGIEAFFDGTFAFTDGTDQAGVPFSDDIPIPIDNPFIPADLRSQFNQLEALGESPAIAVSRDLQDVGIQPFENTERTTFRIVAGLRGEFESLGWDWEVSYNYGRTEVESTFTNTRIEDRYYYAIDAVALTADTVGDVDGTLLAIRDGEDIEISPGTAAVGDIVCRSELDGTAPGVSPFPQPPTNADGTGAALSFAAGTGQCAPINIFGRNSIQGAGADFAFLDIIDSTVLTQQQFLATLSGDTAEFFELPGGPLGFAGGFEYREDTSLFVPSTLRNSPAITSGAVNGGPTFTSPDPTFDDPSLEVYEGFFELRAPILADMEFIELLEVGGAVRLSDYNTIGQTTAYEFSGRYKPTESLTLRGTFAVAVRAPNLAELFGPQSPATLGLRSDPCDANNIDAGSSFRVANCNALVGPDFDPTQFASAFRPGVTGGNPDLQEEEAETFTVGAVWQPAGGPLDGLTVIVDYYDISIEGAIGSLTGAQVAAACVDLPTLDNQFCDAVDRNPNTGVIDFFRSGNVNLGSLTARGIDFAATYSFDMDGLFGGDGGRFDLSVNGTRFLEAEQVFDATAATLIASIEDPLEQEQAQTAEDITNDLLGEFGRPEWIANFGVTYRADNWSFGWQGRFESSQLSPGIDNIEVVSVDIEGDQVVVNDDNSFVALPQRDTGDALVSDFTFTYDFSDQFNVYGGVNNAFDKDPFLGTLVRPIGVRGRYFYMGIRGAF